jgi:LacI family transcriptional regulator
VTSVDVARHLGVSQSTVSLALSGASRVSDATRRRVLEACDELDYRPNAAGRRLRTGRSDTIGLFVPKLGYEVFDRILRGVRQGLAEADDGARWSVLVGSTDNDLHEQDALTDAVRAHDFDGLILAAVNEPDAGPLKQFAGPVVGIEMSLPGVPIRSYDLNQAARTMLDLLRGHGHRRFAHLSALPYKTSFALQRVALQNVLSEAGESVAPLALADADDVTLDAGIEAIAPLLEQPATRRPTAVICDDSRLAAAVYAVAADAGLVVPTDLSVITSHLDSVGRAIRPALTGLLRPAEAVGALAARALLDAINGAPVEPEILLDCVLVPGESVAGCPPVRTPR